ncbi:MAG: RsmD family RNA methyltransferase [Candidatus Dormibacteria bacterium]
MPRQPGYGKNPRSAPGARLTGGEAAGRRLLTESAPDLRPATGLVRAACFNILGERVLDADVLDLFAGVGSLGLEALSRGARRATFVEIARPRVRLVQANLGALGWSERGEVVVGEALAWLRREDAALARFGLVLLDPPFRERGPELFMAVLRQLGLVAKAVPDWDPVVVGEHHRKLSVPTAAGALNCVRTARYGTSVLSFYRRPT